MMPTIREVLQALETLMVLKEASAEKLRALDPDKFLDSEQYQDIVRGLQKEESDYRRRMEETIERYERLPERHQAHFGKLEEFYERAPDDPASDYEKSVFIMTKFPQPGEPMADELQKVIDAVRNKIRDMGFCPRIASEHDHHEWLWANVEVYLLGCSLGVAVVEDRYRAELNPNVAMEWGWMRGMGRKVLFLRESKFKNDRADWSGLLSYSFDWDNPEPGIETAIGKFLG